MGVRAKKIRGEEQFFPTRTEISRLHLSKKLHLRHNNVLFIPRAYYLFVHYKIRIMQFETNKPNPIARLSSKKGGRGVRLRLICYLRLSKNCSTFTISEKNGEGGALVRL